MGDYSTLIPFPIIVCIICIGLWRLIHKYIEVLHSESYMLEILLGFLLALYLVHTASIYNKVDKERTALLRYWDDEEKDKFCKVLNERISTFSKNTQFVIVVGVILLCFISPMSTYGGSIMIGVISFFMAFLKRVTEEVDDPINGTYRLDGEKIRERWPDVYATYFENPKG